MILPVHSENLTRLSMADNLRNFRLLVCRLMQGPESVG